MKIIANYKSTIIQKTAQSLVHDRTKEEEKIHAIFEYVRDAIKFGFPAKGDLTTASETVKIGYGQCNTKSALFIALCRAMDIEARIHFSLIEKEIQWGVFPKWIYKKLPEQLSHSWVEIKYKNQWIRIDSFINDTPFYDAGKNRLQKENRKTGYSISCKKEQSSPELHLDKEQFVQMDSVTEDHGTYTNPEDYYSTNKYQNRPGFWTLFLYKCIRRFVNNRIKKHKKRRNGKNIYH